MASKVYQVVLEPFMEGILNPKKFARRFVPKAIVQYYKEQVFQKNLPEVAKRRDELDRQRLAASDAGCKATIEANLAWLCRAQDCSASNDGGVARHFSLVTGWSHSYPETTGYVAPTMLAEAEIQGRSELKRRAEKMLDWLVDIQMADGAFRGGMVHEGLPVPVTFNTGQILLGLSAGAIATRKSSYISAMHRAAQWLVDSQDNDGCWRKFPSPFAGTGEKTYETHVSWGLFEAERAAPGLGYGEAGLKQVHWALGNQQSNGWFRNCCLSDSARPLTHTIGYALRGIVEAYRLNRDEVFLEAATRTASALAVAVRDDGYLSGRFDSQWKPGADWVCLTGSAQLAYCWLQLFEYTGEARFLDAGLRVNSFVRRTVAVDGDLDQLGGVRGSYPISGAYGRFQYLNWAAKFCIDSLRKELEISSQSQYIQHVCIP